MLLLRRAGQPGLDASLARLHPVSLAALLLTLVMLSIAAIVARTKAAYEATSPIAHPPRK